MCEGEGKGEGGENKRGNGKVVLGMTGGGGGGWKCREERLKEEEEEGRKDRRLHPC